MATVGCFIGVVIARTADHIPLCSYADENYKNSNTIRQEQQRILERMVTPATGPSGNGCHYQSFDHKDCVYFAMQDAATGLTVIAAMNKLLVRAYGVNELNAIGCELLDKVFGEFIRQFSFEEFSSASVKPFQFIKFETTLQKCVSSMTRAEKSSGSNTTFSDGKLTHRRGGGSTTQYNQLKTEIAGVHDVIRKNYVDLMERGERLDVMDNYSAQLKHDSSQYYKATVRLNRMRLWKMYGPPAVVAIVFILFLLYYFFF